MPLSVSNFAVNADGTISFTIADAIGPITLLPPFAAAFPGASLANGSVTLTPAAQASPVSGTLQINDTATTVDVTRLYVGTDDADTYSDAGTTPIAIFGFGDDDTLGGGSGNDWILGGDGADTITGGEGADDLRGGAGDDIYVYGSTAEAAANENIVEATGGGTDRIETTDDADLSALTVNGAADLQGADTAGIEQILIEADTTATFSGAQLTGNSIVVNESADGTTTLAITVASGATVDFSNLTFAQYTDGNAFDDGGDTVAITGAAGNETITGTSIADRIVGGEGADTLSGGAGNDRYLYASTAEAAAGENIIEATGGGTDRIQTTADADLSALTVNGSADLRGANAGEGLEQILIKADSTATFSGAQLTGNAIAINETADGTTNLVINVASTATVDFSALTFGLFSGGNAFGDGGDTVTINGAGGNETITGTTIADRIFGNAGADRIFGLGGNDTINSGEGNDVVDGGTGNDTIIGGSGAGDDLYDGGADNDTVDYSSTTTGVSVTLVETDRSAEPGGAIAAILTATGGSYTAATPVGKATGTEIGTDALRSIENVTGGSGADTIVGSAVANILRGGGGIDQIWGGAGDDKIYGDEGNDILVGGVGGSAPNSGNDELDGGAGNDQLYGDDGNDILRGGTGSDQYAGGAGNDTLYFEGDNESDTAWGGTEADTFVFLPNFGVDTIKDFFAINTDKIDLRAFTGLTYADLSLKQVGKNVEITSVFFGSSKIVLEVVNLAAMDSSDILVGPAVTRINGTSSANNPLNGDGNANIIDGKGGNDVLKGMGGDDVLIGGAGNDTLDGGTGADAMAGGTENDTYIVDNVGDTVFEQAGQGTDTVQSSVTYTLADNVENLTLTGSSAIDGAGNGLANVINGNEFANKLVGGAGNDTLNGNGGDDILDGGAGNDTMNGGGGTDTVTYQTAAAAVTVSLGTTSSQTTGGSGSDKISNVENLTGSNFNDKLTGSGSANVITGLKGTDTLTGGGGADKFVFNFTNEGLDTITDFLPGTDALQISKLGFGISGSPLLQSGTSASSFNSGNSAGYFFIDTSGTDAGTIYWDADGNGAGNAVAFVKVNASAIATISISDFLLV